MKIFLTVLISLGLNACYNEISQTKGLGTNLPENEMPLEVAEEIGSFSDEMKSLFSLLANASGIETKSDLALYKIRTLDGNLHILTLDGQLKVGDLLKVKDQLFLVDLENKKDVTEILYKGTTIGLLGSKNDGTQEITTLCNESASDACDLNYGPKGRLLIQVNKEVHPFADLQVLSRSTTNDNSSPKDSEDPTETPEEVKEPETDETPSKPVTGSGFYSAGLVNGCEQLLKMSDTELAYFSICDNGTTLEFAGKGSYSSVNGFGSLAITDPCNSDKVVDLEFLINVSVKLDNKKYINTQFNLDNLDIQDIGCFAESQGGTWLDDASLLDLIKEI